MTFEGARRVVIRVLLQPQCCWHYCSHVLLSPWGLGCSTRWYCSPEVGASHSGWADLTAGTLLEVMSLGCNLVKSCWSVASIKTGISFYSRDHRGCAASDLLGFQAGQFPLQFQCSCPVNTSSKDSPFSCMSRKSRGTASHTRQ